MRPWQITAICQLRRYAGWIDHGPTFATEQALNHMLPSSIPRMISMADFVLTAHNDASPFADMRGHHVSVGTPDFATAMAEVLA